MASKAELRAARERFAELLEREGSLEREWQTLFSEQPFILSESLPLRLKPSQIVPLGRPGRSEPDFVFYPDRDSSVPSSYGVIELKRPSTPILTAPRREVIKLSSDADTAHAQAKLYAAKMSRELYAAPERLLAVGSRAHIFLIVGNSNEIRAKIVTDIHKQQFDGLLPAGVELLPYDTLFRMFEKRVPPRVHVVVPASYALIASDERPSGLFAQLARVFISYARPDSSFAEHLTRELAAAGIRVWNYQRDLRPGMEIEVTIRKAIEQSSTVLLVLSQASAWREAVNWELFETLERQNHLGKDILLPVALDSSWRESPIARVLRRYDVLDFSQWQDAREFRRQFRRLVASLQIIAA